MTQGGGAVTWPVDANGVMSSGKGMIRTARNDFTDYQLHVEFATPSEVKGNSQGRGNSGVFLNGVFEIQVLDSFENKSYADGQASAMYGQYPPMVNASRKPGEWQSYDITFTAPRFTGDDAREAGDRHRAAQRRRRARRPGVPGPDHAPGRSGPTRQRTRRASSACRTTATPCASGTSG